MVHKLNVPALDCVWSFSTFYVSCKVVEMNEEEFEGQLVNKRFCYVWELLHCSMLVYALSTCYLIFIIKTIVLKE